MALIHDHFFSVARQHEASTAIVWRDQNTWKTISYRELARRVEAIGQVLASEHIEVGDSVGVAATRHPDVIATLIAVLAAGARYVPIDLAYPQARQHSILSRANVTLVLMPDRQTPESSASVRFRSTAVIESDVVAGHAAISEQPVSSEGDMMTGGSDAYVMFTSGSTGEPKGVSVPHRAVLRLVIEPDYITLGPDCRMLLLAPLSFDASTLEIWGPLLNGGACILFPDDEKLSAASLGRVISEQRITHAWITASLFNAFIDQQPSVFAPLQTLVTGGEALSVPHIRKALDALPDTQLVNGYGPTENTTFTTCYAIPADLATELSSIPIGRPIRGTDVVIVDDTLQRVAPGEVGELVALGDGLANGYVADEAQTRQRFVSVTDEHGKPVRGYRTGDRVRQLRGGDIVFLGRTDDQVKIEGHRIEPGEIEAVAQRYPGVRGCRVVARRNRNGQLRLVAYLLADESDLEEALRDYLSERLPHYMMPHYVCFQDTFPLTANGKLAVDELPDPTRDNTASRPTGGTDRSVRGVVQQCWVDVLGNLPASDANFFDAGGTSLDTVNLHAALQQQLGQTLAPTFVYEFPTIDAQVTHLEKPAASAPSRHNRGQRRRQAMRGRRG